MMVEKCAAKEGANKEDAELLISHKPPKTFKGKCVQACLAETAEMVKTTH